MSTSEYRDPRFIRIMMAQFKKATKEPNEFIKFHMDEEKPWIWHILLSNFTGDKDEYKGGQYIFRMEAPADFPHNPPHFYARTPQGLYEIDQKVCINIGEWHKDQYRAALGMDGFANQLVSGLIGWETMGGGIKILTTSLAQKQELALKSPEYNKKNLEPILIAIEQSYQGYSKQWDLSKIPEQMQIRLGLKKEQASLDGEPGSVNTLAEDLSKVL